MLFLLGVKELGSKDISLFIHSPPLGEVGRGLAYTHEKGTRPSTEERPEYNVDFETLS